MKNNSLPLIISVLALAGVLILLFLGFSGKEKLAYVDNGKLLEKYVGMVEVRRNFEAKSKGWQANIDTLGSELERGLKKYERERASMSVKERALAEELLNNKQEQFLQYREALQKKAKDEESKMSMEVLGKLNSFIKKYGKKHRYKIIFGANASGNIIYADDVLDITEAVIQAANDNEGK